MSLDAAIVALNKAEAELQKKLDNIQAAKLALKGLITENVVQVIAKPLKLTRRGRKKVATYRKSPRHRAKCCLPKCGKGFFTYFRGPNQYCSLAHSRIGYELKKKRNPSYMPGGKQYEKYVGGAGTNWALAPKPVIDNKPLKKGTILLKGDALSERMVP